MLLVALVAVTMTDVSDVYAVTDPALTGGSAVTGHSASNTAITDVQVTGTGNPTVPVKLRVTSGSLSMTTTTGLTFTGPSTGSTLQFSGTRTNVNTALATLQYLRTGTGTDTLEASLVNAGEVFFSGTNHLYEYVSYTSTWDQAKANAETRTKYGATGYLTTIASLSENDFVKDRLSNAGWMGASDSVSEGDWKWVTGPETGTSFWSGTSTGSTVGGQYANWGSGEPNNAGDEDCAQFLTGGTGKWNDLPCNVTTLPGYVVEYGSTGSPIDISSLNVSITTLPANQTPSVPSSLGPTTSVNASWGNNATPTMSFTLSDPDGSDTMRYQVQVDDSMNFSSPVVDYTSALTAQGARSFTVGQTVGSGSYAVGSAGQSLSDRQYYWRVKAIDNSGAESAYVAANSGNIAFRLDTGAPDVPSTPTATTPTGDTTPTWSWGEIEDMMSGFGTLYMQWSQDATFASGVISAQQSWSLGPFGNSYTIPSALGDGTWYFRIRAVDAASNDSGYSPTGSVVIDTTAPTAPGVPQVTTPDSDNTPEWQWTASTDSDSGLSTSAPYTLQYSTDSSFTSYTSVVVTTPTYTHTTPLADGTWYARVVTQDNVGHTTTSATLGSITINTTVPPTPSVPAVTPTPAVSTPATRSIASESETYATDDLSAVSSDTTTSSPIILNNYASYLNGSGQTFDATQSQIFYFTHKNEQHTITLSSVFPTSVTLTIASTPTEMTIPTGTTKTHDVDGDGVADISIEVLASTSNTPRIVFTQLAQTDASDSAVAAESTPSSFSWLWLVILVGTLLLIVILLIARRKHTQSNKNRR